MAVSNMKNCRGCIYRGYAGSIPICQYILFTHRCRPCPAGDGCTVKTTTKGEFDMKKAWDETRARQLYEEGKSDLDIADMVGASVGAITAWRHRNRLKIKTPTPRKAPERTPAPVKLPPIENPAQTPAVTDEPTAGTTNKPNLDALNLCGPVELSFSIAGCACSLSAPDTATAAWAAKYLCGIVENFAVRE